MVTPVAAGGAAADRAPSAGHEGEKVGVAASPPRRAAGADARQLREWLEAVARERERGARPLVGVPFPLLPPAAADRAAPALRGQVRPAARTVSRRRRRRGARSEAVAALRARSRRRAAAAGPLIRPRVWHAPRRQRRCAWR